MAASCPSFKSAFLANMAALHLPAPDSLWTSYTTAMANVTTMLSAVSKLGAGATVAEIAGAATGLEVLGAIAAISAAGYTGACIGSMIIAADKSMVCTSGGQAATTVSRWASNNGVRVPQVVLTGLQRDPAPLMPGSTSQSGYAMRNRVVTNTRAVA